MESPDPRGLTFCPDNEPQIPETDRGRHAPTGPAVF